MIIRIAALFLLLAATSCMKSSNEIVMSNDFEELNCWCNDPQIRFGQGHSGFYFTTTDSIYNYSTTFGRRVRELGPEALRGAELSVWIRPIQPDGFVNLLLSVERDHKIIYNLGTSSKDKATSLNQWYQLEAKYTFPEPLQPNDLVKVFLMNNTGKRVDGDDFELRFKY